MINPTIKPIAAASIAVFRGDLVLVAARGKEPLRGLWSLPGGHIEPGETAAAAALRELAEETGVIAVIDGLADVVDVIRHEADGTLAVHFVIAVFAAQWVAGEPLAASDSLDARFVTLEALAQLSCTDRLAAIIHRARTVHRASLAAMQHSR
jgi:8-oxo-dGTP diphosphatase